MQLGPRSYDLIHLAVHSEPHGRVLTTWFDVNVACISSYRLHKNVIDEVDNGAAVDQGFDRRHVQIHGLGLKFHGGVVQFRRDRIDLETILIAAWKNALNAGPKRKYGAHS